MSARSKRPKKPLGSEKDLSETTEVKSVAKKSSKKAAKSQEATSSRVEEGEEIPAVPDEEIVSKKISKAKSKGDKSNSSELLTISLEKKSSGNSQTAVYFSSIKKKGETTLVQLSHPEIAKFLKNAIDNKVVTGKPKEVALFRETNWQGYNNTVVVGLGSDSDGERYRQAGAAALKCLQSVKNTNADLFLDGAPLGKLDSARAIQSLTEGIRLAGYSFDDLKTKKKEDRLSIAIVSSKATEKGAKSAFEAAQILADSVNFSRWLGDMPGNLMTPTILADSAVEKAKGTGIKATVWDKARIAKEKMGGLLGVAHGSAEEPRFIILEYKGAAASKKPVVFVGKGLTFDTGGISIKPSSAMEEMKYDMCGGANVIGALIAIARLKLKVNAIALVPSTENMPGSRATKPGDVHTARNGKTFEVNNTDAEGRLILADALAYGSELKPELMVDAATLTGAMVIALGNIHTGYFTRNDKVSDRIQKSATVSSELVWRMPLTDFHVDDMKGTYADLSNISASKGAGSATAAAFLEQFVESSIPWAHFDIAGTGWSAGNRLNYCTGKGASGAMVRTFVEIARQFEK